MNELPHRDKSAKKPNGARKFSSQANINEYIQNFQKNYINKYSLLFFEKEELLAKNKNLVAIIEEQKQTITKLMSSSKQCENDAVTQKDEVKKMDAHVQTDVASPMGKNLILFYLEWLPFSNYFFMLKTDNSETQANDVMKIDANIQTDVSGPTGGMGKKLKLFYFILFSTTSNF